MSEIQAFAELPNSRWLARFLRCVPPVDNNRKWRTALKSE
jgi:hypothetical protein